MRERLQGPLQLQEEEQAVLLRRQEQLMRALEQHSTQVTIPPGMLRCPGLLPSANLNNLRGLSPLTVQRRDPRDMFKTKQLMIAFLRLYQAWLFPCRL